MDINNMGKKLDNTKLIETMKAVRQEENEKTREAFFSEVVISTFIVPAKFNKEPKQDENGKMVFEGDLKVNFALPTTARKENVLPVFTDDESISASQFADGFKRIVISYKEIAELVMKSNGTISGMAVNPFTENCYVAAAFMKDVQKNLESMANRKKTEESAERSGLRQKVVAPGSKIKLRTPKYQPVDMLEAATEYLKGHPEVDRAYLQMMEEDGSEDKYLIVLDMEGDDKSILTELLPQLKPHSFGIEVVFSRSNNPLGKKVVEVAQPFYEKAEE